MITEKEIIEIMRNINQYEFTTYLGYYMAVAKAIIDKIKEKEKPELKIGEQWIGAKANDITF